MGVRAAGREEQWERKRKQAIRFRDRGKRSKRKSQNHFFFFKDLHWDLMTPLAFSGICWQSDQEAPEMTCCQAACTGAARFHRSRGVPVETGQDTCLGLSWVLLPPCQTLPLLPSPSPCTRSLKVGISHHANLCSPHTP